ncbi:lipid-A-disaccharide synthase [Myroides odoratimimus]|uniref:Lipid-A-disaccharide synthase n=1 Tax=Myroides odoratimimus CIP 101113 TaxID=883154 RepID=A0AAV3F5T3_9FLAO|nr:lipid-A-disaccharide synthase [Myroides odoratimimus]EHO14601.1 lipid-A-disaccharide synthase [Myroides odoratimimus CIP 101113]SHM04362.1 lipid-A-disaccharide synthase [Myroides odoratimimus subsp. xuanwuensis]
MKYYIIAGEASGDLHGSNLMRSIYKKDPEAEIRFWGGDLMQQVGGKLVKHYKDLAFMGFVEVVQNLGTILRNIKFCKKDIASFNPDVLVFIDYPGFNMRIAKWAKKIGIETHYYISPQIWAWKENRINDIKRDFDFMYVILPFEKDFYEKKHNYPVTFVGHPLIDAIANYRAQEHEDFRKKHNLDDRPVIALLPGSRKQEISRLLNEMLSVIHHYPQYQFVIAGAPGQEASFYETFIKDQNISFVFNETYALLNIAHAALVTSGTATLETALFSVPQVVLYKGNQMSYEIAKRIIKLKYISLVNLIMDDDVVVELIQGDCNAVRIEQEFAKIIQGEKRNEILLKYKELIRNLGGRGASDYVADEIIKNHMTKRS